MNDIIISAEKIENWKKEKIELEAKIREHQAKLELTEKRLQAVALFIEKTNEVPVLTEQTASSIGNLSTTDAIVFVLRKSGTSLTAGEIRLALGREGYPKDRWGKTGGYFYAVLKRLADHKKIAKRGDKYGAIPDEHAQAKTANIGNDMSLQ